MKTIRCQTEGRILKITEAPTLVSGNVDATFLKVYVDENILNEMTDIKVSFYDMKKEKPIIVNPEQDDDSAYSCLVPGFILARPGNFCFGLIMTLHNGSTITTNLIRYCIVPGVNTMNPMMPGISYEEVIFKGGSIGIKSIEKTATQGLVDTYTITFEDDSTECIDITNGADGKEIERAYISTIFDESGMGSNTQGLIIVYNDGTCSQIGLPDIFSKDIEINKIENGISISFIDGETIAYYEIENGKDGKDGYIPVKGVDYWTALDKEEINTENVAFITEELAKRGQLKPEFANSIEECTDTTKLYVLPDGNIYGYIKTTIEGQEYAFGTENIDTCSQYIGTENSQRFAFSTNTAPASGTLKSITVKHGQGGKALKIAIAHTTEAQDGTLTIDNIEYINLTTKSVLSNDYVRTYEYKTDFFDEIEIKKGDLIGYEQGTGVVCQIYWDTDTTQGYRTYNATSAGTGYTLEQKTYAYAISATVETEPTQEYAWDNTGHAFVPADYEDRIIAVEEKVAENKVNVGGVYVSVPEKIRIIKDSEFRMYYKNVVSRSDTRLWFGSVSGITVKRYAEYLSITATEECTKNIPWRVYDNCFNILADGFISVTSTTDNPGTVTALIIGDSTVTQGNLISRKLLDCFSKQSGSLTLLGTKGAAPALHEGRAGWRAAHYCTVSQVGTEPNPFFNNGFDFAYYMESQGYSKVDVVVIQLGINDIFGMTFESFTPDATLEYIQQMVSSVTEYDSNIKVIVNLLSVPNGDGISFTDTYGTSQIDFVNLTNSIRMSKALIERFSDNVAVALSPNNCVLDPIADINDGVHPNEKGYEKLGQMIYETIISVTSDEGS